MTECKHIGCNRKPIRRQLCSGHYRQLMGYVCRVTGCPRQVWKFGMCSRHLEDPTAPVKKPRELKPKTEREKPVTKDEFAGLDLDDFWEWVKIELKLESNKKITTEKLNTSTD